MPASLGEVANVKFPYWIFFFFSTRAFLIALKTLNVLIVFYETINYRILKPRKEAGVAVVIAACAEQCGH